MFFVSKMYLELVENSDFPSACLRHFTEVISNTTWNIVIIKNKLTEYLYIQSGKKFGQNILKDLKNDL